MTVEHRHSTNSNLDTIPIRGPTPLSPFLSTHTSHANYSFRLVRLRNIQPSNPLLSFPSPQPGQRDTAKNPPPPTHTHSHTLLKRPPAPTQKHTTFFAPLAHSPPSYRSAAPLLLGRRAGCIEPPARLPRRPPVLRQPLLDARGEQEEGALHIDVLLGGGLVEVDVVLFC